MAPSVQHQADDARFEWLERAAGGRCGKGQGDAEAAFGLAGVCPENLVSVQVLAHQVVVTKHIAVTEPVAVTKYVAVTKHVAVTPRCGG
jgi:hypothetical protein